MARGAREVEVLAHAVLQVRYLHQVLALGYAYAVAEVANRLGRVAASPHARQGGHARVVPAAHVALLHQAQQLALAHDGVGDVEPGELALARMHARQFQRLQDPFVEGAVNLELQAA